MYKTQVKDKKWVILFLVVCLALWLIIQMITWISPIDLTRTRQNVIESKLHVLHERKTTGTKIENLPVLGRKDNSYMDGWNRPMKLEYKEDMAVIISYGRDGKHGGVADDQDIITTVVMKQN